MNCDVVVIGGGPAGMAAALESAKSGAKTILIEREAKLGGILNQCIHNGFGLHYFKEELTGPEYAHKFNELINQSNVEVLLNTFVVNIEESKVSILNEFGQKTINAKSVVLAMGCRERTPANITLTGSRPVGVYMAGQAQRMTNIKGVVPGKNIVILGSGDIGLIMARRLTYCGCNVKMVLEIMPESGGLKRNIAQCLNDYNIPLKLSHTILNVLGDKRVTAVEVVKVDANLAPIMETKEIVPCDCVILSVGLTPETDLVQGLIKNPFTNGAEINEFRETNVENVFSCGNVLHVHDLVDNVSEESILAGFYAAKNAKKLLNKQNPIKIIAGEGIRYCSPSTAFNNKDGKLVIYFRLKSRIEKTKLYAISENVEIASKFVLAANAGEMQKFEIDKNKINGDIIICVKGAK